MSMSNAEIRAKILRAHYDLEMTRPGDFLDPDLLPRLMPGVPRNLLDANLIYLYESGLIRGEQVVSQVTPICTRIAPLGIDLVERPQIYSGRFPISVQVLNVNTNLGQVAQASSGASIAQTQTYSSFEDLRRLVDGRTELKDAERQEIEKVLTELEKAASERGLTQKIVDEAKKALAKYGWIIPPLVSVLSQALGLHVQSER